MVLRPHGISEYKLARFYSEKNGIMKNVVETKIVQHRGKELSFRVNEGE